MPSEGVGDALCGAGHRSARRGISPVGSRQRGPTPLCGLRGIRHLAPTRPRSSERTPEKFTLTVLITIERHRKPNMTDTSQYTPPEVWVWEKGDSPNWR